MDIKKKVKEAYEKKMVVYDENNIIKYSISERFLYLLKIVMREVFNDVLNVIYIPDYFEFKHKDFNIVNSNVDISKEFFELYANGATNITYNGKANIILAVGKSGTALLGAF